MEDEVRQYVVGKLCDPKYRKRLARLADTAADDSDSLADQLAEAEAQRDRLLDLYLEQKVTKAAYERRYEAPGQPGRRTSTRHGLSGIPGSHPQDPNEAGECLDAQLAPASDS
ncbi:MAG: hypothetical protein M3P34_08455, partial [Actinomycetota bacterium]|nr:hypothetical protein [Actinomycetota bacterium]